MIRWKLKRYELRALQCGVVWDNATRVTNLKGLLTTTQANNQNFGDDALDRLITTTLGSTITTPPPSPTQTLGYDAVGHRISGINNGINNGTTTYRLATNCHLLASSASRPAKTCTDDALANPTNFNHHNQNRPKPCAGSGVWGNDLFHFHLR